MKSTILAEAGSVDLAFLEQLKTAATGAIGEFQGVIVPIMIAALGLVFLGIGFKVVRSWVKRIGS